MKALQLFACLLLSVLLAACATQSQTAMEPSASAIYMDRVERQARNANVEVIWINPPKTLASNDSEESN